MQEAPEVLNGTHALLVVRDTEHIVDRRVELDLSYGFDNMTLAALVGPVFDKIAGNLVDAFVKRAESVYG